MRPRTQLLEIRPDHDRDPAGEKLERLLAEAGVILFPVLIIGFLVSAAAERWWNRRLRQAEREITVRRTAG
jgi:hypothetical protein